MNSSVLYLAIDNKLYQHAIYDLLALDADRA